YRWRLAWQRTAGYSAQRVGRARLGLLASPAHLRRTPGTRRRRRRRDAARVQHGPRSGVGDGAGCRAARCLADRSGAACSGRAVHHPSLSKLRVPVLASGRGTNLQALLDACATPDFPAQIVVVGCNRATAQAIGRAEAAGVPVCLADRAVITNRETRQQQLLTAL